MLHTVFEIDMGKIFRPTNIVIANFEFGISNARNRVNSFRTESSDDFMKIFDIVFFLGC